MDFSQWTFAQFRPIFSQLSTGVPRHELEVINLLRQSQIWVVRVLHVVIEFRSPIPEVLTLALDTGPSSGLVWNLIVKGTVNAKSGYPFQSGSREKNELFWLTSSRLNTVLKLFSISNLKIFFTVAVTNELLVMWRFGVFGDLV